MTVKLECVYKHVVHDWKEMGIWLLKGAAILAAITIAGLLLCGAGVILYEPLTAVFAAFCKAFTAYNVMIALTAINVIGFTFGIAYCWNKDSFKTTATDTDDHGTPLGTTHEVNTTTWDMIGVSMLIECVLFIGYVLVGILSSLWFVYYESPAPILLAWVICAIIGIPIACAIARCKE
jgi:hypothetical protein